MTGMDSVPQHFLCKWEKLKKVKEYVQIQFSLCLNIKWLKIAVIQIMILYVSNQCQAKLHGFSGLIWIQMSIYSRLPCWLKLPGLEWPQLVWLITIPRGLSPSSMNLGLFSMMACQDSKRTHGNSTLSLLLHSIDHSKSRDQPGLKTWGLEYTS